jgi:hypothetical protein
VRRRNPHRADRPCADDRGGCRGRRHALRRYADDQAGYRRSLHRGVHQCAAGRSVRHRPLHHADRRYGGDPYVHRWVHPCGGVHQRGRLRSLRVAARTTVRRCPMLRADRRHEAHRCDLRRADCDREDHRRGDHRCAGRRRDGDHAVCCPAPTHCRNADRRAARLRVAGGAHRHHHCLANRVCLLRSRRTSLHNLADLT